MATSAGNCRIKIASKNRNCGNAKFVLIFCRKNKGQMQKASGTKVADRQHIGVENLRDDRCRIETARVGIGPIFRTDFCGQGCYSSIDTPKRRGSVVVSTSACHVGGRGSIPGPVALLG